MHLIIICLPGTRPIAGISQRLIRELQAVELFPAEPESHEDYQPEHAMEGGL
jgi:hypothetical protein